MISKEIIQEILETARIDEVVGEFVTLKKRGANMLGLCPFHNEKTPSFTVSPKKGYYKCFGCGKGGNAVSFIMEHEQFTYPEALKYLAKKYNIKIEEEEQTPEQIKELNEKESLFHVTGFAAKYFADNIFNTDQGKAIGLTYFKERGFREDIIKKFQLGYAIDEWTNFTDHALKSGYKPEYLERTGLTIFKEKKKYDRFRARVIFPIHNLSGRVLGFGGRTLSSDKTIPKYVNSPESDIYHKSKVLYGINLAKSSIITNDNCYLVEGYTDVVSLHQAGVENVVASSGTSLTTDQIKLINRYTKNISILYDGDEAGIKASFRGIDMILEQGMDVKIVLFPQGEDPDSFARSHRSSEVQEYITKEAVNFIFFKTNLLLKETQGDPIKLAGLIKEIVNSIALIPDAIVRMVYIKECAEKLDVGEQTLMNELNRVRHKRHDKKVKEVAKESSEALAPEIIPVAQARKTVDALSAEAQEKEIIRLLMSYSDHMVEVTTLNEDNEEKYEYDVATYIVYDLKADDVKFSNPLYQKVYDATEAEVEKEIVPGDKFFLYHPSGEISKLAATLLTPKYDLNDWSRAKILVKGEEDNLNMAVFHAISSLKLRILEQKFEANLNLLNHPDADFDTILVDQKKLQNMIGKLSAELSRIVIR